MKIGFLLAYKVNKTTKFKQIYVEKIFGLESLSLAMKIAKVRVKKTYE